MALSADICAGARAFAPEAERLALRRPGSPAVPRTGRWRKPISAIARRSRDMSRAFGLISSCILRRSLRSAMQGRGGGDLAGQFRRLFRFGQRLRARRLRRDLRVCEFERGLRLEFLDGPVNEESLLRPTNPYARSKAAAEQVIADILPERGAAYRGAVVQPHRTRPGRALRPPLFAAQIARIEAGLQPPLVRVGNLDAKRDFLDVRDVCDAIWR